MIIKLVTVEQDLLTQYQILLAQFSQYPILLVQFAQIVLANFWKRSFQTLFETLCSPNALCINLIYIRIPHNLKRKHALQCWAMVVVCLHPETQTMFRILESYEEFKITNCGALVLLSSPSSLHPALAFNPSLFFKMNPVTPIRGLQNHDLVVEERGRTVVTYANLCL